MDIKTKEQRSYNMSRISSKNTKPELLLFSILKREKIRFRKHFPIAGKPDIAFPKKRIAIFINGEFWPEEILYHSNDPEGVKIMRDFVQEAEKKLLQILR